MSVADAVLEIIPDSFLTFDLSAEEAAPNCTLELRHPDSKAAAIAFKVRFVLWSVRLSVYSFF
jgi:hypothetical protein